MAHFARVWLERIEARRPYLVSIVFVLTGLGCLGYGAAVTFEVVQEWRGGDQPSAAAGARPPAGESSGAAPAAPSDDGSALGAAAAPRDPSAIVRRRVALLAASACMAILGLMSIAIGAYRARLVRLEQAWEALSPPAQLN